MNVDHTIGLALITIAALWLTSPIYTWALITLDLRRQARFDTELNRAPGLDGGSLGEEVETWLKEGAS